MSILHAAVFPEDGGQSERRRLELSPPAAFKAAALLLWGSRPGSIIHQLSIVGTTMFMGALPAAMFESDVGWEYFESVLRPAPHHGYASFDTKDVGKFFRLDCPAAEVGHIITLDLEGQVDRAVLIGRMLPVALPAPEPGVFRERTAGQQQ